MGETLRSNLGITVMDRDHEELHRLIHLLEEAVRTGQDWTFQKEAIDRVVAYVDRHFLTESALMSEHGYPPELADAHEAEHQALMERVKKWQHPQGTGRRAGRVVLDMTGFLQAWVHHHVEGLDVQLARFLKSRGVS